jgi:hypothetical protein
VSNGKSPGVQPENSGCLTPDTNNSYQKLIPTHRGLKRFLADLDNTELEALFARANEYVVGRLGWSDDFLTARWKAFCKHHTANGTQSYNWSASLELWLDNPHFQPPSGNSSPPRLPTRQTNGANYDALVSPEDAAMMRNARPVD